VSWSTEQGAHGPIVVATGAWLIWRSWAQARAAAHPGSPLLAAAILIPALLLYVLSRITSVIEIEGLAMYATLIGVLYFLAGGGVLRLLWFPLIYLAFILPPPDSAVSLVTQPLKVWISSAAVSLLYFAGYPVASSGVTIHIAQYELLVAQACSGLNSLISLSAIGLFYVYVRHSLNWRYAGLLMLAIVPVAIFANLVRVLLLILITYYFGDAVAQGFVHNFAGVTMFAVALTGIFAIDALAAPIRRRLG
jgi:exosortase